MHELPWCHRARQRDIDRTPVKREETVELSGLTFSSYVEENFISGQKRVVIHGAENIF